MENRTGECVSRLIGLNNEEDRWIDSMGEYVEKKHQIKRTQ